MLKCNQPDITAPGVDILAAYSPIAPISIDPEDKRRAKYNILIGTSMSCPHTAGVAAYVKSFHPDWSPSAIKSAIMTTGNPLSSKLMVNLFVSLCFCIIKLCSACSMAHEVFQQ